MEPESFMDCKIPGCGKKRHDAFVHLKSMTAEPLRAHLTAA